MQFLYPIGFIALASLLLPILIHLWRVKQGKTLRIGSISLLGESAASNCRNFNISEWLLFLLRCLLFLLLALLITQPYLKGKPLSANKAGWILLDQQALTPIYQRHQKKIDSLLKKGYQLRHFGQGFQLLNLKDTLHTALVSDTTASPLNYTSLLRQANHQLSNGFPIWVFAPKYASQLDDVLPNLQVKIHWQSLPPADTSKVKYTQFLGKAYQASLQAHAVTYSLANARTHAPLNVMVHPSHTEDADYVKAALSAIGSYLEQPILFRQPEDKNEALDAIFWLSRTKVPREISERLKPGSVLFTYANSKALKSPSSLLIEGNESEELPRLKIRNAATADTPTATIWKDGFGHPVLTVQEQNQHHHYTLYTQLHPQWTDLVWRDDFAQALIPILYHENPSDFAFKQTQVLNEKQPVAVFENAKQHQTTYAADRPLDRMIWILAFIVLLLERLINFSNKKLKTD